MKDKHKNSFFRSLLYCFRSIFWIFSFNGIFIGLTKWEASINYQILFFVSLIIFVLIVYFRIHSIIKHREKEKDLVD